MYRLQRALRACPLLAPSAVRPSGIAGSRLFSGGRSVEGRQVRIINPLFTPRRLATFALYSGCVGGYLWWVSPEVELEVTEAGEEQHGEVASAAGAETEEDEWSEEDSWFVPLTWAKKLPRTYYKGSDPEWQEFRKVAKDKDRLKRIYKELVSVVLQGVSQHPALAQAMGKNPEVGKVWLDVTFPDGPPQDYSRKGIEIADEYIALSEQRLTQEEYHRNVRLIWPTGMVDSLYAYWKTLMIFQYQKVRAALGIDTKVQPGSPEHRANHMLQMLQVQQASKQASAIGKTQTNPGSGAVNTSTQTGRGVESTTADQAARSSEPAGAPSDTKWFMPTRKPGEEPAEKVIATAMFAHTLQKSWSQTNREPPRGTFIVAGLVQIKGQRAMVTLDVQAFYDPKASKFAVVNVSPKTLKRWNQAPRGGP